MDARHAFGREPLPENFPALPVQRKNLPLLAGRVRAHVDRALQHRFKQEILVAADRRGEKNPVAPNDGARMSEPRNLRLPGDIPIPRQVLPVGHARSSLTPELRPILRQSNDGEGSRKHRWFHRPIILHEPQWTLLASRYPARFDLSISVSPVSTNRGKGEFGLPAKSIVSEGSLFKCKSAISRSPI